MTTLTHADAQNAWLKGETESPEFFSREAVTVKSGNNLSHGEIIGKVTMSCPTTGTAGTNTGNGLCASVSASAKAKLGTYSLRCITTATNGGTFSVVGPDGYALPNATVGTAYTSTHINFTISDGSTDFVSGDTFTITIVAGSGQVVPISFSAVDGSQNAYGIMFDSVDATSAAKRGVSVVRNATIQSGHVTWPSGATSTQISTALAALAAKGIIDTKEV